MAVLTMMVGANISPEQLLSIAERTIMEADTGWGNFFNENGTTRYPCNRFRTELLSWLKKWR